MHIDDVVNELHRFLALPEETFFLWGPRQSGKTTLIKSRFPDAYRIDLLKSKNRVRYQLEPGRLWDEVNALPANTRVVIDEIQKVPALLDEVQSLIQEKGIIFALCGSSARQIRRSHANLLGGRALKRELLGFSAGELGDRFSLERMLNHGYLPPYYLHGEPADLLEGYVDLYLKEEILDEGVSRNLPLFASFLRTAAIGDTEIVNFSNVARECGVAASTVRGYYEILVDTLVGDFLPAYTRRAKRRVVHAPKFYFHDVGVVNHLVRRSKVQPGGESFGKAFENWIFHELSVYKRSRARSLPLSYWRLSNGAEVDFVLGDAEIALEAKGKDRLQAGDLKNLRQFKQDYPTVKQCIVVCLEPQKRLTDDGILILPYREFVADLWNGGLVFD